LPVMSGWRYGKRDGHVFRWSGAHTVLPPDSPRADGIELLTAHGWVPVGRCMAWFLWRGGGETSVGNVKRRVARACCEVAFDGQSKATVRLRLRASLLLWLVSPPLPWGAPRMLADDRRQASEPSPVAHAINSFASSLRGNGDDAERFDTSVGPELVEQARSGWERAVARHTGIESRAGTFIQAAGLTTTVVLVNNALLSGDDRVTGNSRTVFIVAIVVASALLLVAGFYGLVAVMRTFGRVAPDNATRLIERAGVAEEYERHIRRVAALLVAQRRTSIVADWKLARLKRATLAFALAAFAVAVASVAYLTAPAAP
jgi:hypothetical protein